MSAQTEQCRDAADRVTEILDGTAPASVFEHIASCDACRDLRFDTERAIGVVGKAGADFRAPEGYVDALVASIFAARPDGPEGRLGDGRLSDAATSSPRASTQGIAADVAAHAAQAGHVAAQDPIAMAMGTARTELSGAAIAEPGAALRTSLGHDTAFDGASASLRDAGEREAEIGAGRVSKAAPSEPFVPVQKTMPLAAVAPISRAQAHRSDAAIRTGDDLRSAEVAQAITGKPVTGTDPGQSEVIHGRAANDPPGGESAIPARGAIGALGGEEPVRVRNAPSPNTTGGVIVPLFKRPGAVAGMSAGLVAAIAAGWMFFATPKDGPTTVAEGPWSGKIAKVTRASTDGAAGLDVCRAAACTAAAAGAAFEPGSTLKTDNKTRARIELADGTVLAMDRGSELELPSGDSRAAVLKRGVVSADVAHVDNVKAATFELPQGRVEIIGTKLLLSVSDRRSTVEVARGEVKVTGRSGKTANVRAGEEATVSTDGEVVVANATSLADSMEWSHDSAEEADAPALRGLGELRARKPGDTKEKDRAVRLAKHSVKTRIVDTVARTEVEEVFTNETDEELEGIFRFPLPPGAQIERLALEVDGKLIDGAFVDRDRGAAIWRGVIQNAAPRAPRPREEIIWVPGPWRDPALLEWQRGGRFELKIFPIPKKGSRRIVLAYTQLVPQSGGTRHFTYPLAHDPSGSTKVDDFSVDVQVLGNDREFGVQARGYDLKDAGGGDTATKLAFAESNFVPAGDLSIEYALPNRQSEITSWAYRMTSDADPSAAPGAAAFAQSANAALAKASTEEKNADAQARAIVDDRSAFVAIALRPKLPRWSEGKERVHAIVVDSSRSMVGESFGRATRLASSIVREMDRRDEFVLLACDVTCQAMGAEPGRPMGSGPIAPSASAADDVERFLAGIEPDGGSDLVASVEAARSAVGSLSGKELRVVLLGDGTPSVGPTRPSHIEAAVRHALPSTEGSIVAVALGADADTSSLQALARGGGGVVVPYVPGQRVASAALGVLQASYGVVLRDPVVELPVGLTQVTPARMDPILGGDETYVFARMTGDKVEGTVKLRGKVGGESFEQTYPANIVASTSAGNAFVPRLFASAKIDELERLGGAEVKPTVVALSQKFAVASRSTSLLVLESEAMFDAFGLDRSKVAPAFTGEERADSQSADQDGEAEAKPGDALPSGTADELNAMSESKSAPAKKASRPMMDAEDPWSAREGSANGLDLGGMGRSQGGGGLANGPSAAQAAPSPTMAPPASAPRPEAQRADDWDPFAGSERDKRKEEAVRRPPPPPRDNRGRNMVPMRRVFDRKASFTAGNTIASDKAGDVITAEGLAKASPDSRDKMTNLFALYAATGRIGEAQELAARWASRDALDPDALQARADLAARQGDRERGARILSGLADLRPGDRAIQERLAAFHEAAGQRRIACRHRLSLADLVPGDAKLVSEASKCAREQGLSELSGLLRADAPEKIRSDIDRLLAAPVAPPAPMFGDVRLAGTWNGGEDLDISLIDATGKRFSWSGAPGKFVRVSTQDATSSRSEKLAFSNLAAGSYTVEIARTSERSTQPVSGELSMTLPGGEVRRVPFTMTGPRAEVGTVKVFFTSRLVPIDSFSGDGGGGWRGNSF